MVTIAQDTWWRKSLRQASAQTFRALPIPQGQKWSIAGRAADLLESPVSPHGIARMAEGFKMRVDLRESYERRIYYSGVYGTYLTRLFKNVLIAGDTMIDGGTNIGYFTLLAARLVGEHGHVHAFEPIPQTFSALEYNIHLNSFRNVHPNCQALSRSADELCFEVPADESTGSALGRLATIAVRGRGTQCRAAACTLDEYAARTGIDQIKLVKLDIEGSEVAAIEGMQRLLSERRIAYLICELNTILLDELGISHSAMREALQQHGYRCYYIHTYVGRTRTEHLDLIESSRQQQPDSYGDYLFVAPDLPQ